MSQQVRLLDVESHLRSRGRAEQRQRWHLVLLQFAPPRQALLDLLVHAHRNNRIYIVLAEVSVQRADRLVLVPLPQLIIHHRCRKRGHQHAPEEKPNYHRERKRKALHAVRRHDVDGAQGYLPRCPVECDRILVQRTTLHVRRLSPPQGIIGCPMDPSVGWTILPNGIPPASQDMDHPQDATEKAAQGQPQLGARCEVRVRQAV
mmetsp:Transcript_80197/g.245169  ORF Transcript_80197/g.245169 Transcript_80197/m.245169 type:complete len:204 (-) Transcript_80197:887-1498(-)